MRIRTSIVLAAGLLLIVVVLGVTLSRAPRVLAGENSVPNETEIADLRGAARLCQTGESLPAGTSALRIGLNMALGTRMYVEILAGSRVIARGTKPSGWRGTEVTVPVQRLSHTAADLTICAELAASNEPVGVVGANSHRSVAARAQGKPLPGRVRIEYLRDGTQTWWSKASAVDQRLGLGRAWSGGGIGLLALVLMGGVVAGASWLAIRTLP
jgi:hypothetical protein